MGGIQWEPIPGREGIEIKSSVNLPKDESEIKKTEIGVEKEIVRRRLKLTKEDVREFGMTAGCRGCAAVNRGGQAVNHSEDCRKRIKEELVKKGDSRVSREREKWEEELTEALEEEDKKLVKMKSKEEEDAEEQKLFGDNGECQVPIKLSPHVFDDVCLVFELETVGIIGLSIGLLQVHETLLGKD